MPDINQLQTHKWVLPIKENTDLPSEQQGYLMVREITPFGKPDVLNSIAQNTSSKESAQQTEKLLVDAIVSVHNISATDSNGVTVEVTDPARVVKLMGKRLVEKLSEFMVNPVSEDELGK